MSLIVGIFTALGVLAAVAGVIVLIAMLIVKITPAGNGSGLTSEQWDEIKKKNEELDKMAAQAEMIARASKTDDGHLTVSDKAEAKYRHYH